MNLKYSETPKRTHKCILKRYTSYKCVLNIHIHHTHTSILKSHTHPCFKQSHLLTPIDKCTPDSHSYTHPSIHMFWKGAPTHKCVLNSHKKPHFIVQDWLLQIQFHILSVNVLFFILSTNLVYYNLSITFYNNIHIKY